MLSSDLQKVFEFQAAINKKFACHWVDAGQHWYVCSNAFMCEDTNEKDIPCKAYGNYPSNPVFEEDPSRIYPENCMEVLLEDFSLDMLPFLYTGKELVALNGSKVLSCEYPGLAIRLYRTVYNKFDTMKGLEAALCVYTRNKMPVLRISQGKSTLYLMLGFEDHGKEFTVKTKDAAYTVSQWSDINKCYNKIERKDNMALKDTDMNKIIRETLGVTPDKVAFDPEKTGGENIAAEKQVKKEVVKPAAKEEQTKETPPDVPAEESAETPAAEPVKRTRKKAEVTKVQDLTKIIEQLGGAVPDNMSSEDVQREIRQCRDLVLAATRRIANVSLAYVDKNSAAQAKLDAIKAAL